MSILSWTEKWSGYPPNMAETLMLSLWLKYNIKNRTIYGPMSMLFPQRMEGVSEMFLESEICMLNVFVCFLNNKK